MANTNNSNNSTAQTGAMTLVLLVNKYRSQMVALLLKNGVVVPQNATDQDVAMLMVNLLKVSKSFSNDLNTFLSNPKVLEVVAGGMNQTAQYLKMSGNGFMNASGFQAPSISPTLNLQSQYGLDFSSNTTTTPPETTASSGSTPSGTGSSWWTGVKNNYADWISGGIKLLGTLSTNNANSHIADAQATIAQAGGGGAVDTSVTGDTGDGSKKTTKTSTATVVLLSLTGVAVVGAIVYFVMKSKK
jgi:hypothetical protein